MDEFERKISNFGYELNLERDVILFKKDVNVNLFKYVLRSLKK
jgi:hypothetical protein